MLSSANAMPGPSIHELLGLPSDVTRPNAYQVFGLALGEADQQVIRTAIERRISTIKQAKSSTEPDVWMQAVRAVQTAQKVLMDPEHKAALDAKYGILNEPGPVSQPASPAPNAAADPLAALLPGSKPITAASSAGSLQSAPSSRPAQILPTTIAPQIRAPAAAPMPTQSAVVQVSDNRRVRRKRGSGNLIFGSIVVVMLGVIVAGLGYLYLNGGNVQVVKSGDGFQVSSGPNAAQPGGSRVATPQPVPKNPRGDGIMKPPPSARPSSMQPMNNPASMPESQVLDDENDAMDTQPMTPEMPAPEMAEMGTTAMDTQMTDAETMPDPSKPPTPPASSPPSTPPGPDPEQIAASESAIKTAHDAIITGDWANMKSQSEIAAKKAVTDEQKEAAETLYQFADLATHYRSGVQKAMAELVAGNEFKLTDSMTFLVQKSSAQQITLYRNKREYSYTLDDLPLSVASALAPFGMNVSSPEGKAAEAVFQVISPKTTAGHRAQSIDILRGLPTVRGADPQKLADFIASLGSP